MGQKKSERRRAPRLGVHLPVAAINGEPQAESYVLNISEFGAKIRTSVPFGQGEAVDVCFSLPGEGLEISCRGEIVWVLPAPLNRGHFFLGLRFFSPLQYY